MSSWLLGLDVGGGSCRSSLLEIESGRVATARRAMSPRSVPGSGGIAFDLDLDAIFAALSASCRELLEQAAVNPSQILGVAATAMRFATVLLDRDDEALLAVPNRDARAIGAALQLAAEHGDALAQCTGHWPSPVFAGARLRYLATEVPESLERASSLLSLSDWITWKLCGERVAESSQAGESGLFDLQSRDWAWDWIDRFAFPRRLFPELRESGSVAGKLGAEVAAALGLRPGTPVAVGGADTQCGLLGAGAVRPGDLALVAGTTAPLQQVVEAALVDPEHRLWTGHHVVSGRYVVESNAGPAGEVLSWFARTMFPGDPHCEARLFSEARDSELGAAGLLSSFGAQVFDARSLAMPVGDLTLTHMSSAHDARPGRHVARALIEGLACAIRANRDQLAAVAGQSPAPLRLAGGLSRSPTFARIVCELLGEPIEVSEVAEASSLGAAMCAGVGAGVFESLEEAGDTARTRAVSPDRGSTEAAEALYSRWTTLRETRADSQNLIAGFVTPFALAAQSTGAVAVANDYRPRILACADLDDASLERLREIADLEYAPFREKLRLLRGDSLVEALEGVEVFVTEIDLVDVDALARLPALRLIAACRGDAVNVDVAACTAYGIPVLHTPGRNADAVADLTLSFLLMLARRLPEATAFLRTGDIEAGDMAKMGQAFSQLRGRELWRKTVGLVGFGAVGREVARRLQGFGAEILVFDPLVDAEQAAGAGTASVSLEALLARSDFVSLHAAVNEDTRGMIAAPQLARMQPGACLINTARAALCDEAAIAESLATGHLGGAAFDTFSVEPPGSDHPLLAFDNVIATPHIGGNTEDIAAHQGGIIVGELERMLVGEAPRHALNPEVLEHFDFRTPRSTVDAARLAELGKDSGPSVTDLQQQDSAAGDRGPAEA